MHGGVNANGWKYEQQPEFAKYPPKNVDSFQTKPKNKTKPTENKNTQVEDSNIDLVDASSTDTSKNISTSVSRASSKSSISAPIFLNNVSNVKTTKTGEQSSDKLNATPSQETKNAFSPFVTLTCPVCTSLNCPLNKASRCPLLQYNELTKVSELCEYCGPSCECAGSKQKFIPVSGIVPTDENNVPITLLRENGGPVEDSCAYANRQRWCVPKEIHWRYQVDQWISAKSLSTPQDSIKPERIEENAKNVTKSKSYRKKSKQMSLHEDSAKDSASLTEPEINNEVVVLMEGQGFQVISNGKEKILINFDSKNCKYLGCTCEKSKPKANDTSCGCNWANKQLSGNKKRDKYTKKIEKTKSQWKHSVVKEASESENKLNESNSKGNTGEQIFEQCQMNEKKKCEENTTKQGDILSLRVSSIKAKDVLHLSKTNVNVSEKIEEATTAKLENTHEEVEQTTQTDENPPPIEMIEIEDLSCIPHTTNDPEKLAMYKCMQSMIHGFV